MARSIGLCVLLALAASPIPAWAQSLAADGSSQARMAKYFSNVPIGAPGGHARAAPLAPAYGAPAGTPYSSVTAYEGAPPTRLPALPPVGAPVAEPAAQPPAEAPGGLPGAAKPARIAPPTPAAAPKAAAERPAPTPAAPETKSPPPPLPADPAYQAPKPPAYQAPRPPAARPAEIAAPAESLPIDDGQCWATDESFPSATSCGPCGAALGGPGGWRRWLDPDQNPLGIRAGGWIDFGGTVNTFSPRGRSNYPVTFNDRSNDVQMNQLYAFLERKPDAEEEAWQLGGRVDLLYGTDHVYATARGLETFRNGQPKWNSDNGPVGTNYGLAMPQAYMEVFAPWADGLSVKLGHFYTIMGYETVTAPDNFFYSHAYAHQYGEPFTHTGLLAAYALSREWTIQAGFTRGWDTWEDNNNDLAFLGGIQWTNEDGDASVALTVHAGPEADEPPGRGNFRTTYSLVYTRDLTDRLTYVLQHDYGYEPRATIGNRTGNWYGINQYVRYKINNCWSLGGRFEWFHDKNGVRTGLLEGADFYEITLGLNWTPRERLLIRPEVRWDWAKSDVNPYVDHTRDHQILVAVDAIVTF